MKTKTTLTFVTFPVMNLLLLISMHIGHAQAPAIEWQKCLGGTANEVGYSIQPTTDGGYIGVGWTYGNPEIGRAHV